MEKIYSKINGLILSSLYLFMRKTIFTLCICLVFACNSNQDNEFQKFYNTFQENMDQEPLIQALIENRLFLDSFLIIPKEVEVQRILNYSKEQLTNLHTFEINRLNPDLHEHYNKLHALLSLVIDKVELKKNYQTDPEIYFLLPYLNHLSKSTSTEEINLGLSEMRSLLQTAIENLQYADSSKLETAVQESIQTFNALSKIYHQQEETLSLNKKGKKDLQARLNQTKLKVKDYIGFCNSKLFDYQNQAISY